MIDLTGAVVGFVLLIGLMSLGLHVAFVMFAISALGVLRANESQRCVRQVSAMSPRSSTTCSMPASTSRLLTASPAWPAPITTASITPT